MHFNEITHVILHKGLPCCVNNGARSFDFFSGGMGQNRVKDRFNQQGQKGVMPFLVGEGGANRVKERFHQGGHLGLIMHQVKIYLHAKYGSSWIKNERVMIVLVSNFYGNTSKSSSEQQQ